MLEMTRERQSPSKDERSSESEREAHISVLILSELLSVAAKFIQESSRLMSGTFFEDTFKYMTAVRMSRETVNFIATSIRDEEEMFGRNSFESALRRRGLANQCESRRWRRE